MNRVIATYHVNYLTCGVARFNKNLANRMNVPFKYFEDVPVNSNPILSIKLKEFDSKSLDILMNWSEYMKNSYDLILHGLSNSEAERFVIDNSRNVYACNHEDFKSLKSICQNKLYEIYCPADLTPIVDERPNEIKILSFGMAHKLNERIYIDLRDDFEKSKIPYRLYFSAAVHEGYDFEDSFLHIERKIHDIFAEKANFLGFASDRVLSEHLQKCDIFATFFNSGYRENNTSANAALAAGTCLMTNVDLESPNWLIHKKNFLDVRKLDFGQLPKLDLQKIGANGKSMNDKYLSWENLVSTLNL